MPLNDLKPDPKPTMVGGIGRPKPKSGKRAAKARREEIRAAKVGPCIVCLYLGVQQELPSSLHHVCAKSIGGYDGEWHEASVCGDGTNGHHGLIEAHDHETCQAFAIALKRYDLETFRQAIAEMGIDRFARRYKIALPALKAAA